MRAVWQLARPLSRPIDDWIYTNEGKGHTIRRATWSHGGTLMSVTLDQRTSGTVVAAAARVGHLPYAYFEGEIVPLADAKVSVAAHALQYGTSAFGGIRGYL